MQNLIPGYQKKKKTLGDHVREFFTGQQLVLQLMVLPAMLALIVFSYVPIQSAYLN